MASRHGYNTRNRGASCTPGAYTRIKIANSVDNSIKKVKSTLPTKNKPNLVLRDFVNEFEIAIISNLTSKGSSYRRGYLACSKDAFNYLKNKYNVNKRTWTSTESIFKDLGIDKEIYRNGDEDDKIECVNLQLKFNKPRLIKFFGKDATGKIVKKTTKVGMEKLSFKFVLLNVLQCWLLKVLYYFLSN